MTISDLWDGPPDGSPEMKASIVRLRAERELKYATCPRCGTRNPVGVDEQTKENKQWRWGFLVFSGGLSAGIWFFPTLAWALVAIDAVIVAVIFYALRRVGGSARATRSAVLSGVTLAAMVATAIFYPRWVSIFAFVLFVQSARKKQNVEEPWEQAKAKLQFRDSYR